MQDSPAVQKWRKLVAEQAESGLTIRAFAESRNLKTGTLAWWRSRLAKLDEEGTAPTFTALTVAEAVVGTVVLALEDRRAHVVIDEETDLVLLRRVLEVLA